jgi:hypothetical protein
MAHGLFEQEPCHGSAAARGADSCGHDATRPGSRAGSQRARCPVLLAVWSCSLSLRQGLGSRKSGNFSYPNAHATGTRNIPHMSIRMRRRKMLQGNSIGNPENIRGVPIGNFWNYGKFQGVRSRIARTLGYSPGLELALNICPSEGIALAARAMVQDNFASILYFGCQSVVGQSPINATIYSNFISVYHMI